MIWTALEKVSGPDHPLCRHVASEIASASGGSSIHPEHVSEVAQSVTAYWSEVSGDTSVPSEYLALLVSRALHGVGEGQAARRIVADHFRDTASADVAERALGLRTLPPSLWNVFASRLLRPSRWAMDEGLVWVLDLSRLNLAAGDCMELSFLQALRALLQHAAGIWDSSGGEGVLGLRGLAEAVRRAGLHAHSLAEVEGFCRRVLRRLGEARGWWDVPRVLSLDVPQRPKRRRTRRGGQARRVPQAGH